MYWEASSGDLDHYEIFESNFATGDMPPTIISRPDPIEHPEIPPPSNATLTRYKDGNPYLVYYYQVRACNAAGGDSGCSAYRGIAEMCVGSPSTFGPNRVVSTTYYHTDALGSPVAETNTAGTVIKRSRYEPYGLPATSTFADAPGYTGHVEDSFTQLSYMQQRYYDPLIGRFLSNDPMASSSIDGANFNRYWYANNSPYKFTDPDGRLAFVLPLIPPAAAAIAEGVAFVGTAALAAYAGSEAINAYNESAADSEEQPTSPEINPADVAGKTPDQIDSIANEAGLIPKGPDPMGGRGAYVDPATGKQRILVHPDADCGPHCHVNDSEGNRLDVDGNRVAPESPEAHLPLDYPKGGG